MRALFWLLAVFAAAVALVLFGHAGNGYVLFVYPPYRLETSLLFFGVAAVAVFAAPYFWLRLAPPVSPPPFSRPHFPVDSDARQRVQAQKGKENDSS